MLKKTVFFLLLLSIVITSAIAFLHNRNFALLNPKGLIAQQELDLIKIAVFLAAIVVVPVFALLFYIVWKFREGQGAQYTPEIPINSKLIFIWWVIPTLIISILAFVTWQGTHKLDPSKPLEGGTRPLTIQVVALQWKWLFIYPQEDIAAVNFVQFPANTPINFELTADAPMNSFWIPQLGGQMYAMAGMGTALHLEAKAPGEFSGRSAELSGSGFAGMKFTAKASSLEDYTNWVQAVKKYPKMLDLPEYNKLSIPSEDNKVAFYAKAEGDLFNHVMLKFMPNSQMQMNMQGMQ